MNPVGMGSVLHTKRSCMGLPEVWFGLKGECLGLEPYSAIKGKLVGFEPYLSQPNIITSNFLLLDCLSLNNVKCLILNGEKVYHPFNCFMGHTASLSLTYVSFLWGCWTS